MNYIPKTSQMTASPPDLSILIVNWNSRDFLRKCLASLYKETHGLAFEVIVVDNASLDGAAELVAAEFPKVRFIQSETNLGFARANNLAFEFSAGKAILLLNPDTEIIGDAIPRMLAALNSTADAGVVGCKLLNTDLSIQTPCIKRFPTILGEILSIEWLRLRWPRCRLWSIEPLFSNSPKPVCVDAVSGACQLIPRDVYQAVGGLNAKYFMYAEDIEISATALRQGRKTYYVGSASIIHHGGQSSIGKDRGNRWISIMQKEAMWQFFRSTHGSTYAAVYRMTIAFVSLLWIVVTIAFSPLLFLLRGRDRITRLLRKWGGGLQWSLGFEKLTNRFRGRLAVE
jgi:N-acetylglucosaminyl-diphospho-decaprenol L-rhamnosyltransferase